MLSYNFNGFTSDIVCIDEFKGDVDGYKYQAAMVDPVNSKVLNVFKKRHKDYFIEELLKIHRSKRMNVNIFITDMWDSYINIGERLFSNVMIVIDRFHYVRLATQAMYKIRKEVQKTLGKEYRKYFKHSRKLLI